MIITEIKKVTLPMLILGYFNFCNGASGLQMKLPSFLGLYISTFVSTVNEAPNNNDITHIANIILNKAPNSNEATCIAHNVHLTTMGAQHSQWQIYSHHV